MAVFIDVRSGATRAADSITESLEPYRGVCVFVDITNSTEVKYVKGLEDWIRLLGNTFGVLEVQAKLRAHFVKFIGDAIMIFIPDDRLYADDDAIRDTYTLLEEVRASIDILKMLHIDEMYMKCKVSIHYCEDVYNITFFKDHDDYYGKDIDLTARLLSKARENSIVVSESFYEKLLRDLDASGRDHDSGCLADISGIYIEDFKGVPDLTEFRRLS
jgi:class 3 adenylate cyclase